MKRWNKYVYFTGVIQPLIFGACAKFGNFDIILYALGMKISGDENSAWILINFY